MLGRMTQLLAVSIALSLQACSTAPVVKVKPEIVRVEVERLVPIDSRILAPCLGRPPTLRNGLTGGDLILVALAYQESYSKCLEGKLESIRALQPKTQAE
jgi:hypothetical protein